MASTFNTPKRFAVAPPPAQFYAKDTGNGRTNNSGVIPDSGKSRTASIVNLLLAPKTTVALPQAGDNFYFVLLTSPVQARPSGGVFNTYEVGTGLAADKGNFFSIVELYNPEAFPVVVSIFVGFGNYIDNRVIIANGIVFDIANPVYPVPGAGANALCPDIGGSVFTDLNGDDWIAISRTALIVCNMDPATVLLVTRLAAGATPAIAAIQPLTSITLPINGDVRVTVNGAAPVVGVVSEIYQAIPKTF